MRYPPAGGHEDEDDEGGAERSAGRGRTRRLRRGGTTDSEGGPSDRRRYPSRHRLRSEIRRMLQRGAGTDDCTSTGVVSNGGLCACASARSRGSAPPFKDAHENSQNMRRSTPGKTQLAESTLSLTCKQVSDKGYCEIAGVGTLCPKACGACADDDDGLFAATTWQMFSSVVWVNRCVHHTTPRAAPHRAAPHRHL